MGICAGWIGIHGECLFASGYSPLVKCWSIYGLGETFELECGYSQGRVCPLTWYLGLSCGVVMGFVLPGTRNQAGPGCREGEPSWWKLSPFSSPFKLSLKSKLVAVPLLRAGAVSWQEWGALSLPSRSRHSWDNK